MKDVSTLNQGASYVGRVGTEGDLNDISVFEVTSFEDFSNQVDPIELMHHETYTNKIKR